MANKMLIDAAHPEETRVVVVRGNRVEEFDFEAAARKQLRGNIYLAKVTRVEPSLQAAFVDYGGNRHGFLAFSEIHPDYYQIPVADRQALLEEEQAIAKEDAGASDADDDETETADGGADEAEDSVDENAAEDGEDESGDDETGDGNGDDQVESVGAEDAMEEVPQRGPRLRRQYKIQEVIRRRQILLVQVVKEERGNKGAALTTYLSLAGRYSVLMPNTARGGGISRKITNPADRKRLKQAASELSVPEGMGVILRTAGASRTKAEIKRDFEYLLRLWETVRELTLESSAPTLVYEEGSLIKRSIRDLYNRDIDEVLVAGDDGYREAKGFMRMLMPSHAKNVQPYKDATPLFTRFGVEPQLDAMFSPQVTLKSGGYLVINQTEALVAIDVNSGRSTREHSIEDTALATNMEAAEEVSRQLRLRDLAGLIVIDFIDMEEKRNNRAVERRMKDCLKSDRARIQVGRISHFGLMEMSRQRIRTGVLESSSELCPHCRGSGIVRSTESVALHVLRALEDHLMRGVTHNLTVRTRSAVALYILNQKRAHLSEIEARFGLTITIEADEGIDGQHYVLERGDPIDRSIQPVARVALPVTMDEIEPEIEEEEEDEAEETPTEQSSSSSRRRRRRKPRRSSGGGGGEEQAAEAADRTGEEETSEAAESGGEDDGDDEEPKKRRRRGRRGGRRSRRSRKDGETDSLEGQDEDADVSAEGGESSAGGVSDDDGETPVSAEADGEGEAMADVAEPAEDAASDEGEAEPAEPVEEARAEETVSDTGEGEAEAEPVEVAAEDETVADAEPDEAPAEDVTVEDVTVEASASEESVSEEAPAAEDVVAEEPESTEETVSAEDSESAEEPVIEAAAETEAEDEKSADEDATSGDDTSDDPEDGGKKRSGWWQRRSFF